MKQQRASFRRLLAVLLALVLTLSLSPAAWAADGGNPSPFAEESGDGSGEEPPASVSYALSLPGTMNLVVGASGTLTATVTANQTSQETLPDGVQIAWESDDSSRVTVTNTGGLTTTVTALESAQTTQEEVRVTAQLWVNSKLEATASCRVLVSPAEPTGVQLGSDQRELDIRESVKLSAAVSPGDADYTLAWSSSDESVATVDQNGQVTAAAPGEAVITVSASINGRGGYTDTCTVIVRGVVLPSSVTIRENERTGLELKRYGEAVGRANVSWSSGNSSVVTVGDGYLYGVSVGTATVTAAVTTGGQTYSDSCEVTVERNTADVIRASASASAPLSFASIQSQIASECRDVLGASLSYVGGLQVESTSQGTLYYQYRSADDTGRGVSPSWSFYTGGSGSQMRLSEVSFVPKGGFSGTAVISYTGYTADGDAFQGSIQVSVAQMEGISYTSSGGEPVQFQTEDFNNLCVNRTGRNLRYVIFSLPDSSRGTLYRNYISQESPGIALRSTDRVLRSGSPSISDVYFVPAAGYDGSLTISFTACDVNGETFRGWVDLRIEAAPGTGDISYTVRRDGTVDFRDSDFNNLCRDLTGNSLDSVRFTPPASREGTLYYGYVSSGNQGTTVSASQDYYRSRSPYLDQITFVPAASGAGTVSIPFTGRDVRGSSFSGYVEITIRDSGSGEVSYTVRQGRSVTLDDADFNEVCRDETGEALRYVEFELPSSSRGTLYYDYKDGDYASRVAEDRRYYRSQSPYLDRVTFVPASSFTGTVEIPFTGQSTGGRSFDGTVEVTVEGAPAAEITYSTAYAPVTFRAQDFSDACRELGLSSVRSVSLTPPGSYAGRLCYRYTSPLRYASEVRSSTEYGLTGTPAVSDVTFVPRAGYQGTVSVPFTAKGTGGETVSGTVRITVRPSAYSRYFSDMGNAAWAAPSVDYLYENGIVQGTGSGRYNPSSGITRGSFMVMLARAFQLTAGGAGTGFSDVPSSSYCAEAVAACRQYGIAAGYTDGTFRPDGTLTRQDAMTFLLRALRAAGWVINDGSAATLASYPDGGQVSQHARAAVAAMVERGILTGTSDGRLAPQATLTRAQMAVILHRALTQ